MKGALQALRKEMAREKTDVYLIPMDDFHQSEYVSEYFKTIRHITGFTGDSCNVVVTQDAAKFFTDGRFFIQAERELYDGVDLMKMGEKGVPTLTAYIETVLPEGGVLGFDGRCVNSGLGKQLEAIAEKKKGKFRRIRIWSEMSGRSGPPCRRRRSGFWRKSGPVRVQRRSSPGFGRR